MANIVENPSVFIIAEIGVNHNGQLDIAVELIRKAKSAGADAVKFQTFKADNLVLENAPKALYQLQNEPNSTASQYEMLKKLELSVEDHLVLKKECETQGLEFISTPFDIDSLEILTEIGVPLIKISSGDVTNIPLLHSISLKNLPVILSTGMASLGEIELALKTLRSSSSAKIALLHCISNYPATPSATNLMAIKTLGDTFNLPVGWSDHTIGNLTAIAAVTLGATIIEKHITLDKNMEGPDHKASIEIEEFAAYVEDIRTTEQALGNGVKKPQPEEFEVAKIARRSIVASKDISAGETLSFDNLTMKRPEDGLPGSAFEFLLGKKLRSPIRKNEKLELSMIDQ